MISEIEPGYLTKRHATIYSDLKERSLEDAIRKGNLRAFRIGKKTLIEKTSLDDYIRQHEITPTDRQMEKSELQEMLTLAIERAKKETA
jgi:excisionase family DNA binding protein